VDYCLAGDDGTAAMWNGRPDLDLDGDGRFDAVSLDFDGDGRRDDALADFDGDGMADHAVLDLDNDGAPERAERLRDSRVAAQHRTDKGSVTVEDLQALRTQDVIAAVRDACAEKHVPVAL
jgi:hypothetical protein